MYKTKPMSKVHNLGSGLNMAAKQGDVLYMKTLKQGPNILLSSTSDSITITSISGGGGGIIGTGITTGNTPLNLISIPTAINTAYVIDVIIVGANSTTNGANIFFIKGGYKNIGGVLTELVTMNDTLSEIQDIGVNADLILSGQNIIIKIQGLLLNTINWTGEARLQTADF